MILGIIGLILLSIGWVPQTIKIIQDKKSAIDWRFGILYTAGSLFLVAYSFQIKDYIFLILNSFVTLMSGTSFWFSIKKK